MSIPMYRYMNISICINKYTYTYIKACIYIPSIERGPLLNPAPLQRVITPWVFQCINIFRTVFFLRICCTANAPRHKDFSPFTTIIIIIMVVIIMLIMLIVIIIKIMIIVMTITMIMMMIMMIVIMMIMMTIMMTLAMMITMIIMITFIPTRDDCSSNRS
jgi:hypothetical protein